MCVGDETKHCKVLKGRNVCVRKQREEERVRGECRQGMCVGEGRRARDVCVGKQGMCVLGRQGRKSAKGGRTQREEERKGRKSA